MLADWIRRGAERRLGGHGGPTGDLYFANACGDALASGAVQRLSPTVFASESAVLVLRHGAGLDVGALAQDKTLVWLIDDDIEAGIADPALLRLHRTKLRLCERAFARRFGKRLDHIVVSSPQLEGMAKRLAPEADAAVLDPHWSEPIPDLGHFDEAPDGIEIGCLGAATHKADLALVWDAFEGLLSRHHKLRVWVSANHRPPETLAKHDRLRLLPETAWRDYRKALRQRRFHLLAYPMLDTAFNRGRSVNKIIEHGLMGGAGVYSASWPVAERVEKAQAGVLVPPEPEAWSKALAALVEDLVAGGTEARELAKAGQALAARLNNPAPQRQLWSRLMGLDLDPDASV